MDVLYTILTHYSLTYLPVSRLYRTRKVYCTLYSTFLKNYLKIAPEPYSYSLKPWASNLRHQSALSYKLNLNFKKCEWHHSYHEGKDPKPNIFAAWMPSGVRIFELHDRIFRRNCIQIRKIFNLFVRGTRWVWNMKKIEFENLMTHSLKTNLG